MDQELKRQIMGRVYTAYMLREYGSFALNLIIFICASLALYFSVSWRNVFANMPSLSDLDASYNFFTSAVWNTEIAVQLSLAALAVVLVWYAVRFVRATANKPIRQTV